MHPYQWVAILYSTDSVFSASLVFKEELNLMLKVYTHGQGERVKIPLSFTKQ